MLSLVSLPSTLELVARVFSWQVNVSGLEDCATVPVHPGQLRCASPIRFITACVQRLRSVEDIAWTEGRR